MVTFFWHVHGCRCSIVPGLQKSGSHLPPTTPILASFGPPLDGRQNGDGDDPDLQPAVRSQHSARRREFIKHVGVMGLGLGVGPAVAQWLPGGADAAPASATAAAAGGKVRHLTILHTADIHGQLDIHDEFFVEAGKQLGLNTVGVMAEVPSLAVVADQVLEIADFVSIGTNDLTQYTLAADRMLGTVASYQDPWHPAVLRLVKMLGDAGAAAGKSVGICGEAAADPQLAVVLVGLGATTLSMTPAALADVRGELATVTMDQARAKAVAALGASTAAGARKAAAAA